MAVAVVLRVKRKRRGTEPAEALLLACKRLRTEEGGVDGAQAVERSFFKLVATVPSKNKPVHKYVQKGIARDKAAQSLQPHSGSTQRILLELRSSREAKRKENRYRVIASHRPFCAETAPSVEAPTGGDSSDSEAREDASHKESAAGDQSLDFLGKFQLFDIEQEEEVVGDSSVAATNPQETDPDVILCNATEMIREHLTLCDDSRKKQSEKEEEYVYDIYYTERAAPGCIQNILSIQPYGEEYELVVDDCVPGDLYEDEDDENDENNWRNDYPDEEEFLSEEDCDGEGSEESLSDKEEWCGRRTWKKYHEEVLREFGYDEMEELDSD